MPAIPSLLRRRGQASDTDVRRHSLYAANAFANELAPPSMAVVSRSSEQLPQSDDLAQINHATPSVVEPISDIDVKVANRPDSPPVQEELPKHRRFSMLKFRHASESQLSTRARQQDFLAGAPPVPKPPEIITTAPTFENNGATLKKKSRLKLPRMTSSNDTSTASIDETLRDIKKERRKTMSEGGPPSRTRSRVTFDEPERDPIKGLSPPAYGDESHSSLALPVTRLSESSRSDGSSGEHGLYASTTTTTHTIHTTTTFFRLPRRKKQGPLFPLPPKVISPEKGSSLSVPAGFGSSSSSARPSSDSPAVRALRTTGLSGGSSGFASPLPSPTHSIHAKSATIFAVPGTTLVRQGSSASNHSSPSRNFLGARGRSSTLNSLRNMPSEDALPTPTLPSASTRTSTSTGRKSFGDLFGLSHRLRQNSEPPHPRNGSGLATPGSNTSKNNSIQLPREPVVNIPERHAEDTPQVYLLRLEAAVSRGVVASVLSKGSDQFSSQVLRSYMRGFNFFGDPMDMAIRKLLMEVELPKETQHIDRCLQSFANRYHECNPGIYASPDQAYFIAFSLLILHTDVFNKNNKHKMQKADYLKNTQGEGIFDDILECFYDNISYTPFIHVEDDIDINGERIIQHKTKKRSLFPRGNSDPLKRPSKEPIDPYALIMDSKLDQLRPNLKEVMYLEEQYNYLGTAPSLNLRDLQKTFFRTGVLQIVSARSRPDAFMSDKTATNTDEALPGIVDIKITKVGLLWRKDAKKKKTRSPWQEWGAILTGAQLYFFRNTQWTKHLIHQLEQHIKQGNDGTPVIFKPPLESFKPDALMSTDDAVALHDSTYKKHKHAFLFIRHGGFEETFLADDENEMNDWLAKLNYAAAFRTSGVRMRGVVGGNYEGQRTRGIRRLDSSSGSARSVQTPTGEVTIISGKIDTKMAQDILAARREIMVQKISESEEKLETARKQLEDSLRNARHLQILAPIQPKTREQVILAAGRMSAKLKWTRMEIWRMTCHRDILSMDLAEEKQPGKAHTPKQESTPGGDRSSLGRTESKTSMLLAPVGTPKSQRPSTQPSPTKSNHFGMDNIFSTPPPLKTASSFHRSQASWELPPLPFDGRGGRHESFTTSSPRSPVLTHTSSFPATNLPDLERAASPTPQIDAGEQAVLQQAGLISQPKVTSASPSDPFIDDDASNSDPVKRQIKDKHQSQVQNDARNEIEKVKDDGDAKIKDDRKDKDEKKETEKGKLDRTKIRRSLNRTLREAGVTAAHHRSRKGRDSSSTTGAAASEDVVEDHDVLARGTGSFVVHGKKASVITFGSELSNMSPDERLRFKKGLRRDGSGNEMAVEDDLSSVLAEPVEWREHRESAASTSTTTARSFRELHKRLSAHASSLNRNLAAGSATSDGEDDSDAVMSDTDGRRSPLPPVVDEEDEEQGDNEDEEGEADKEDDEGSSRQAAFFTPEPGSSPVKGEFAGRNPSGEAKGKGKEKETAVEIGSAAS